MLDARYVSRIWNMDTTHTKRTSLLAGFLYEKKHLLDYFKITDSKNLYLLSSIENSKYMRYYTLKTHGNSTYRELDVFYSTFNLRETVFFHGVENMMVHYRRKIQRLFVAKFCHGRNTKIFLNVFNT